MQAFNGDNVAGIDLITMAMPLIRRNLDLQRVIISSRALARAPFHSEPSKHKGNASLNNCLGPSPLPNAFSNSKGTNSLEGVKIELLDSHLFWAPSVFADVSRVSSDCSSVAGNRAEIQLKEAQEHPDIDKLEDMRFRGDLLYKLDIDSREPEECNFDSRGRKPKGQSTRHQMKTKYVQDNEKFAESNFHLRKNKNKHMACKQEPGNENYDNVDKESKSVPADFWLREEEALERKKKLMSFKEMTDAYMHPFCLDIFISKSSVCACIVHRVTCNVVAVAQSISKDMKSNLISKKDLTACAAVGGILAQRALADDIYTAVYTPRKGDKLEGKLMVVLQSIIDHGVDIKVRLKQRRPKNCGYMGAGVMADNEENGLKVLQ